tara:strand:+ start:1296 stop:1580 length:285 start_codon:yes stop_codon:yes gene_type:complete
MEWIGITIALIILLALTLVFVGMWMEEHASQDKWISVEERLPEEEGLYLVFRKNPEQGTYKYDIEWLKRTYEGELFWYDYLFITHWQPLTPPTK